MKVIAITNQKGGVGKTTTSMNLSAGLGLKDKKVLLLDLDAQANSSTGLGIDRTVVENDISDVIMNDIDINSVIYKTKTKNVDLIPSSINLAGADIFLSNRPSSETKDLFKNKFSNLKNKYDYLIIDCPPSLGLINKNALTFANEVIIPIQSEYYALEGLTQLLSTITIVKKLNNPNLKIGGILLTMYQQNVNLAKEVHQEINKFFKDKVFKTVIFRNTKLAEAPSVGKSIFDYDKFSTGAKCYLKLTEEFLEKEENEKK